MECTNCGAAIAGDQKFCNLCGSKAEFKNNQNYNTQSQSNNNNNYQSNNNKVSGSMLKFDKMITPSIIQIIFYLGIIISAIASFAGAIQIGGIMGFIGGIFMFLFLCLSVRMYCELIIVIFKINESLMVIRNK